MSDIVLVLTATFHQNTLDNWDTDYPDGGDVWIELNDTNLFKIPVTHPAMSDRQTCMNAVSEWLGRVNDLVEGGS